MPNTIEYTHHNFPYLFPEFCCFCFVIFSISWMCIYFQSSLFKHDLWKFVKHTHTHTNNIKRRRTTKSSHVNIWGFRLLSKNTKENQIFSKRRKILRIDVEMKMYGIRQLGQLSIRSLSSGTGAGNASRLNSLGFIGFGKIAQAMSLGLINKNLFNADQIFASDKFICHLDNIKSSNRFKVIYIFFCTCIRTVPFDWFDIMNQVFLRNPIIWTAILSVCHLGYKYNTVRASTFSRTELYLRTAPNRTFSKPNIFWWNELFFSVPVKHGSVRYA